MYSVYILKSNKDKGLYVGYSEDVDKRLKEHNGGQVSSTRDRRPLTLMYYETFVNKRDAMQREKYFKTGWGRRHIGKLLKHTLE